MIYFAVVSQDPIPIVVEQLDASGYHQQFQEGDVTVRYGVLLHQAATKAEAAWLYLPGVFTHELVETCSDPDAASGFLLTLDGNVVELADLDDTRPVRLPRFEHTVELAAYWSELERKAVAPTSYSLRVALGKKPTDSVPDIGALVGQSSVRAFILAGCDA